ncbi:MAG: L-asparaginase [Deltaproteobacteria bacterium]|nr:MAG: L-asparaginase [Deltaproteobacteria bacterium]
MKKVYILTTGGTIASKFNKESGLYTSGAMTGEELVNTETAGSNLEIRVKSIFQIPSNAMTPTHLITLRQRIIETLEDKDVLGVVVTHGTDTLEESSYFMDLVLDVPQPVVFTGAQRTPGEEGTDAQTNIRDAVVAAASPACRNLGVIVQFNENLYAAKYVKKVHSSNVEAFSSSRFGLLGYVDKQEIFVRQYPQMREVFSVIRPFPRVEIIKAALGGDGMLIDSAAGGGASGLILEGFGRGHVPPDLIEAVSRASAAGIYVVIVTSCESGRVYPVYDFVGGVKNLQDVGAITGHDYDSRKARIKLMVMLAAGITSREKLQQAFWV